MVVLNGQPSKKRTRVDEDDVIFDDFLFNRYSPISVMTKEDGSKNVRIRIDKPIEGPELFRQEFDVIESCKEGDLIKLDISSPGGRLDTTCIFLDLLRNTSAGTIATIRNQCASAATMLAIACDGWEFTNLSSMMIHQPSYTWMGGTNSEVFDEVTFYNEFNVTLMYDVYTGFLNKKEIEKILSGKEMFLNAADMKKHFEKLIKHRNQLKQKGDV